MVTECTECESGGWQADWFSTSRQYDLEVTFISFLSIYVYFLSNSSCRMD